MSLALRTLAALVLATATACGGGTSAPPATCDPTTCPDGCCLGDQCVTGAAATGCGHGGAQCEICAAGVACVAQRCEPPCSARTCAGCCAADGSCRPGVDDRAACGLSGETCQACAANLACAGARCVADSCATTCDGCCQADGTCVAWQSLIAASSKTSATTCGRRGEACATCDTRTLGCDDGACSPLDCAVTCPTGCCLPDGSCVAGASASACGGGGQSCDACGAWSCVDAVMTLPDGRDVRACYLPTGRTYDVLVLDATLPPLTAAGYSWDLLGGLPDPYVVAAGCDAGTWDPAFQAGPDPACAPRGTSTYYTDTLAPQWTNTTVLSALDARHLRLVGFAIFDRDTTTDDLIATCILEVRPTDASLAAFTRYQQILDGATLEVSCDDATRHGVATLHVQLLPH
jgi:hypothetical protein